MTAFTRVPKGRVVIPTAGDLIFVKRNKLTDWIIRTGEFIRFHKDTWSHVACIVDSNGTLVEAIAHGCVQDNIGKYQNVEYMIAHTSGDHMKASLDVQEGILYLMGQVGKKYGWLTVIGTATRFLLPFRGFAFIGSTNICSGLAAQYLTRGTFRPLIQPVTMSPTELAEELGVDTK